jgi:hemerythrin
MLTWEDDSDTDPQIDDEHHKLYRMMSRLEPVILDGHRHETIERAIRRLRQRMEQHFEMEEELADGADAGSVAILHNDHHAIIEILARLGNLPADDGEARRRVFAEFLQALATHDAAVDTPLFRMAMH